MLSSDVPVKKRIAFKIAKNRAMKDFEEKNVIITGMLQTHVYITCLDCLQK